MAPFLNFPRAVNTDYGKRSELLRLHQGSLRSVNLETIFIRYMYLRVPKEERNLCQSNGQREFSQKQKRFSKENGFGHMMVNLSASFSVSTLFVPIQFLDILATLYNFNELEYSPSSSNEMKLLFQ